MTWNELASLDDCISKERCGEIFADSSCKGIHESVLRSFQILDKVEEYLKMKIDHSVILEMLEHVR